MIIVPSRGTLEFLSQALTSLEGGYRLNMNESQDAATIAGYWINKCVSNEDQSLLGQLYNFLQALWKPRAHRIFSSPNSQSTAALSKPNLVALLKLCISRDQGPLLDLIVAKNKSRVMGEFLGWVRSSMDNPSISWEKLQKA